jgi:methionyl-tRNA formyltransferase
MTKITAFLMTEKGYNFLTYASKEYKSLFGLIVVGNDKAIQKDYEEEIITFCQENNIPFIKKADYKGTDTEYIIAISWRWLIEHPTDKLIIFHDALLPRYRGFAPLVNALINGEKEVGVSALFGANGFDTGDIIAQSKIEISYPIKIKDAISLVNGCYLEVARFVLSNLLNNIPLKGTPQKTEDVSYSVWRDALDYKIDWNQSSTQICRLIDSVGYPYKGAYTRLEDKTIRIKDAVTVEDVVVENRHCGKVLFVDEGKPVIICGTGMLKILDADIENGDQSSSFFPLSKFRIRFLT